MKKLRIILSAIFSLSLSLAPLQVFALSEEDWDFFDNSNIFYFDPSSSNCENSTVGFGDNVSIVYNLLISNGYTTNAAYAVIGNLQSESGLNPLALEKKYPENKSITVDDSFRLISNNEKTFKGGFGIAQWTSIGRVQNLQNFANNTNGGKVNDIVVQAKFLVQELNQHKTNLNTASSLEEATFIVFKDYERPASSYQTTTDGVNNIRAPESYTNLMAHPELSRAAYSAFNTRLKYAKQVGGLSSSFSPSTSSSLYCSSYSTAPYTGNFPQYYQNDKRWGNLMFGPSGIHGNTGTTISESGCGPTSFAMLATALLKREILPSETADIAGKAGMHAQSNGKWEGSSWKITQILANHYGLKYEKITAKNASEIGQRITEKLSQGWMIHVSGRGSVPFSEGGHFIGIYGVTEDGKWLVADSSRGNKAYSPQIVINGILGYSNGNTNINGIRL